MKIFRLRYLLGLIILTVYSVSPVNADDYAVQPVLASLPPQDKTNLVLIHSFPTNSIILSGLTDYMSEYFNVYFIDLPGFTRAVPSLASVSISNYADYVHREIGRLGIRSYWVGGVSFGFLVANAVAGNRGCQGVMAIEPFFGGDYLTIGPLVRSFYAMFADILLLTRTENFIWRSRLTQWMFFDKIKNHEFAKIIRDQIDPRTFFATAKLILLHDGVLLFHKKPYALIINEEDDTIAAPNIIVHFNQSVKNGIIIHTTAEHFPRTINKEYFQKHIKPSEVKRLLQFIATASIPNPA